MFLLNYVLMSPGVLFTLPPNGSHFIVALVHGLLTAFSVILTYFCLNFILSLFEKQDDKEQSTNGM